MKTAFSNYIVAFIVTVVVCYGCGINQKQRTLSDSTDLNQVEKAIPDPITEYFTAVNGITDKEKAEKTLSLAKTLMPEKMKKIGGGSWYLNHIAVDIDGDNQVEHLLLFWDDSEYNGILCVLKQSGFEWKTLYSNMIQGWSYSPPSLFIMNNPAANKLVVCNYESITHATGIYESRYRVLSVIDGQFTQILDIPKKFHNYCMAFEVLLTPASGDDLLLTVSYTYYHTNGAIPGRIMFEGEAVVDLVWDSTKNKFIESFSSNLDSTFNVLKYQFLMSEKEIDDPEFKVVWNNEIKATSKKRVKKKRGK